MTDLSEDVSLDGSFDLSSPDVTNDQSNSIYNGSINDTSTSIDNTFPPGNDSMRILFFAITAITILICLTICISVCICICLNRRRNLKHHKTKDHRLLPKQSEKISNNQRVSTDLPSKNQNSNNKQQFEKKISSSIPQSSSTTINGKTPIRPFYYDNLDDIPFIDESRPTSYIDITRV